VYREWETVLQCRYFSQYYSIVYREIRYEFEILRPPGHYPILWLLGRSQHYSDLGPVEVTQFMTRPSQIRREGRPMMLRVYIWMEDLPLKL